MKNALFLKVAVLVLLLTFPALLPQAQGAIAAKGNLKVVVNGCSADQGLVRIALVNSPEGYKDSSRAFMTKAVPVRKGEAAYEFKEIPYGEYAITVYHDTNNNNKLDKSLFGKPVEAYGFSNNVRGLISRPEYKKAAFVIDKPEMTMTIHVE